MIWLIGGTSESVILAKAIAGLNIPCTITVTTENATSLYQDIPFVNVIVGKLELYDLSVFLRENKIKAIVDASHPFAKIITRYAIDTSQELNIPYLRFERKSLKFMESENVIYLENFTTLIEGDYLVNSRALITVGFTDVNLFKPLHRKATLFARLLPALTPFRYIFEAGFSPQNIIAIRPPVTEDFERA
ncbi:MAG TPA: precorrin-6A reductase, partial [Allocoleopsis sp.]